MRKCFHLLILSVFFQNALPAQPGSYSFLHYTTDQGLSNDNIRAICKDRQGFLWIGTVNGLNRFDGQSFKVFKNDPANPGSLRNSFVRDITLGPDGLLWLSTDGGLCILDPVGMEFENIILPENSDSMRNDAVTKVVFDSKGMAWTTGAAGIYKIDPTSRDYQLYPTNPGFMGDFTTLMDHDDRIWLANNNRIYRFDCATQELKRFNGLTPGASLEQAAPLSIEEDYAGKIWVGTWFNGIWKYDPEQDDFFLFSNKQTLCARLLPDASAPGKLFFWVGGGENGLGIFHPVEKRFVNFKTDPRDPFTHNNYIATCFFKDPLNSDVWIGTETGLEHHAPATLRFGRAMLPIEKDMGQFSMVSGAVQDKTDSTGRTYFVAVWGNGVYKWDKEENEFTRFTPQNSPLHTNGIFTILQDRHGFIWMIGSYGASRYDPRTGAWRKWTDFFKKLKPNTNVLSALEDRKGNLWLGLNGEGLYRYDASKENFEQVLFRKELLEKRGWLTIHQISADSLGRLWLAAHTSGVIRFDPESGEAKQFFFPGQTYPDVCNGIIAASNGKVYAGFRDVIVEMDMDGKLLRRFTQQNGLKSSRTYFFVEDKSGCIWTNTEYLLHRLDPRTGTFSYFGKPDGLFSNTITDGLSITPNGEIFIGFQNAFNYFSPTFLRKNLTPPPVAITSIKVMNKERRPAFTNIKRLFNLQKSYQDALLTVRPGETLFTVEFAALNFNQPERNQYAYRLEGFDDDWNYTDRPIATYTNLDGGEYLLRLKAANNDGVWNETGATLRIRVIPPLVKRWYFRSLLVLLALGLLAGIWWYRRTQRKRLEAFRERIARDLHDEMGSTLSSIRFFSEFARHQTGGGNQLVSSVLQRISDSASVLSESLQDIVWAMKIRNDQLEDLASRMTEFGLRMLEARNVQFKVQVQDGFSGRQLTPEQRRNVYLIFKEAVNNAAKYAEATEVELFLALKKGLLLVKISDNGQGFDPENFNAENGGNGLQNMRQRAEEIGGKLDIVSKKGAGTSVELRVKV